MGNQETRHSSQEAWQKVAHKSEHHCFLSTDAKLAGLGAGSIPNSGFSLMAEDDCETLHGTARSFFFFFLEYSRPTRFYSAVLPVKVQWDKKTFREGAVATSQLFCSSSVH